VTRDEFAGAVIPSDASAEVRTVLEKHKIPFREYGTRHDEAARRRALAEFSTELAGQGADVLFHGAPAKPRASIVFSPDATTINLFKGKDLSSFLHESAHLFMRELQELAEQGGAPERLAADWRTLQAFAADETTETGRQEKLARPF
jgi:hypothetical protein